MFEGAGFAEDKAQSVSTASLGQIITPEITRNIGKENNAEYLIQGSITGIGAGSWWKDDIAQSMAAVNMATSFMAQGLGAAMGPIGGMLGGMEITEGSIGVRADMRVIKAETGKVVWQKTVKGANASKKVSVGFIKVGSDKLTGNMYTKAMEDLSTKIVDALVTEHDAGNLFVE